MKKNTYQLLAISAIAFVSFGSYTFLSSVETIPAVSTELVVIEQEVEKEVLLHLPDVSIVQKTIEIGEKLLNTY